MLLASNGRGDKAVELALTCLPRWSNLLPQVAFALADAGDRDALQRLLPHCWNHPDTGFALCGALARAWPEQAGALSDVVWRAAG